MPRLLLVLFLACFLGQITGVVELVVDQCVETCPDDDASGTCAPGCADCSCCGHGRPIVVVKLFGVPELRRISNVVEHVARVVPTGDPREIFHIPKHASA